MTNITIDEKTKVPLFAVLSASLLLIGFVVWLTAVAADASDGAEAKKIVSDVKLDIVEMKSDIKYIKENTPRRR